MNTLAYPASPSSIDSEKLAPSSDFKKEVGKVVFSIILFFIVYVLLLILATGLAIACFYLGLKIIVTVPKFITIVLGAGLVGVGVSVIFFLIKFIFAVSKVENASRVEIKETDQPKLFSFIRTLTSETKTPFPKKIFVSDAVNASVFYNSSFWSMFLPVRKNLEIGLGLVNSINVSEFKAVMAHEFGHFSQRSMKLGSFTYNVNQVIYNMLYENKGYTAFLETWGSLHGLLAIFAGITVKIAQGIQSILKEMYQYINKNYYGLSREMEFHADAVAASVSGGNNLVTALTRIQVAASCYDSALNHANELLKQNKVSRNIFENQLTVFQALAKEHHLQVRDRIPEVTFQFIESFSRSRVNYKNQWASHPSLADRKARLEELALDIAPNESSAWELFVDADKLQEQMTSNLYKAVTLESSPEKFDGAYFESWYAKEQETVVLPPEYNGFYDGRYVNVNLWDLDSICKGRAEKTFEEIFNEENGNLQSSINNNENDLATLRAINSRQIDVTSFDFDGVKHGVKDTPAIIERVEKEIEAQKAHQLSLDKEAFMFFCQQSPSAPEALKESYGEYKTAYAFHDEFVELGNNMMSTVGPFYQGNITLEQVVAGVATLKDNYEPKLKKLFETLVREKLIHADTKDDLLKKVIEFKSKEYVYFLNNQFLSDELNELCQIVLKTAEALNANKFNCYKSMLRKQLELAKAPEQL